MKSIYTLFLFSALFILSTNSFSQDKEKNKSGGLINKGILLLSKDTMIIKGSLIQAGKHSTDINFHNNGVLIIGDSIVAKEDILFSTSSAGVKDETFEKLDTEKGDKVKFDYASATSRGVAKLVTKDTFKIMGTQGAIMFSEVDLLSKLLYTEKDFKILRDLNLNENKFDINGKKILFYQATNDNTPTELRHGKISVLTSQYDLYDSSPNKIGILKAQKSIDKTSIKSTEQLYAQQANFGAQIKFPLGITTITRQHNADSSFLQGSSIHSYKYETDQAAHEAQIQVRRYNRLNIEPFEIKKPVVYFKSEQEMFQGIYKGDIVKAKINVNKTIFTISDSDCPDHKTTFIKLKGPTETCYNNDNLTISTDITEGSFNAKNIETKEISWFINGVLHEGNNNSNNTAIELIVQDFIDSRDLKDLQVVCQVRNNAFCYDSDTLTIKVYRNPMIEELKLDKHSYCEYDSIAISPNTVIGDASIVTYKWEYSGANSDLSKYDDTLKIKAPNFPVQPHISLKVTDQNKCSSNIKTKTLRINPIPKAKIVLSDTTICYKEQIQLNNLTTIDGGGIAKSQWFIKDPSENSNSVKSEQFLISERFEKEGIYNIKLIVESDAGCKDSTIQSFHVSDSIRARILSTNVCEGENSKLKVEGENLEKYKYILNEQDTLAYKEYLLDEKLAQGNHNFDIKIIDVFGCHKEISEQASVYYQPKAKFKYDTVCNGTDTTQFHNLSLNQTNKQFSYWSFGSRNDIINDKTFTIRESIKDNTLIKLVVKTDHNCKDSTSQQYQSHYLPEVKFETISSCFGSDENNLVPDQSIYNEKYSYSWNIDNNTVLNEFFPIIPKLSDGIHNATLKAITPKGCSKSLTKSFSIKELPTTKIKVEKDYVCINSKLLISTEDVEANDILIWYINDKKIPQGNLKSFSYKFTQPGENTIKLEVKNEEGCLSIQTKKIQVIKTPQLEIKDILACKNAEVRIRLKNDNLVLSNFKWDLGSYGTMDDNNSPYLKLTEVGKIDAKVKATYNTSDISCELESSFSLNVTDLPESPNLSDITYCKDQFTIDIDQTKYKNHSFLWNNLSSNADLTVNSSGEYTVKITDTITKCSISDTINVKLKSFEKPNLGPDRRACEQFEIAQAIDANTEIEWLKNNTLFSNDPKLTATETGTYILKIKRGECEASSDTIHITIDKQPKFDLKEEYHICEGESLGIETENSHNISNYNWSSGETSNKITVTPLFTRTYQLKASNGTCHLQKSTKVNVHKVPKIKLNPQYSSCEDTELFLNVSTSNVTNYEWNTGQKTAFIEINKSGIYRVVAKNESFCSDTAETQVTFIEMPKIDLGSNQSLCVGESAEFDFSSFNYDFEWSDGSSSPIKTIDKSGIYWLKASNQECSTKSQNVEISFKSTPKLSLEDTIKTCTPIELNANNYGCEYLWNSGNTNRVEQATQTGVYIVQITNSNNCSIKDSTYVEILESKDVQIVGDNQFCEGDSLLLSVGEQPDNYTIIWNTKNKTNSIYVNETGNYSVTLKHNNGCYQEATHEVTMNPRPVIELPELMYLCENGIKDLSVSKIAKSYQWYLNDKKYSTDRSIQLSEGGKYKLIATSNKGCKSTDSTQVIISEHSIYPNFLVASVAKVGDTLHLINLSTPKPEFNDWNFGNGLLSTESDPVLVYKKEGNYLISLHTGNDECVATKSKDIKVAGFNLSYLKATGQLPEIQSGLLDIVNLVAYPNPTHGSFNIKFELSSPSNVVVSIFDLMGSQLKQIHNRDCIEFNQEITLNNSYKGMLIVRVSTGKIVKNVKVIAL